MSFANTSVGEIDAREHWCRKGEDLLRALMGLLQTVKIHQGNNRLVARGVEALRQTVTAFEKDDNQVSLLVAHGRFFLNEEKFPHRPMIETLISTFQQYCSQRHLQGITLLMSINETSDEQIIAGARLLNNAGLKEEPEASLNHHLEQGELSWLELVFESELENEYTEEYVQPAGINNFYDPIYNANPAIDSSKSQEQSKAAKESAGGTESPGSGGRRITKIDHQQKAGTSAAKTARHYATSSYCSALASLKEVSDKIQQQQRVGVRRPVRLIQNMVDLLMDKEPLFLAMSTIRVFDDYTFTHSVNVAILSMCLGKRLGLSKVLLNRLGLCGLFHDVGKVEIPREVLNKAGKLSEREIAVMRSHPLRGVQQILKLRASPDMKAHIILPSFEHHLRYDLSGYPRINWKNPVSLFGRIVTIADVYDATTSPRVYRPTAMSQDKALGHMLEGSGTDFDPILLKVFINMMGVYPVGTLLELDTGELGLVLETPENAEDYRPIVALLEQDDHGQYVKRENFNLNTRNEKTGKFLKNITSTHHPSTYGIQPAAFIL